MAITPDFDLDQDEEKVKRPTLNFDFEAATADLVQNEGLPFAKAQTVITRNLAEKANFDIDAAYKEGYSNAEIQSFLTGIPRRSDSGLFAETVAREAIPVGLGAYAGVKAGAPLATTLARAAMGAKAGAPLGPYGIAAGITGAIATGVLTDKIISAGIDKAYGEEKPILPESFAVEKAAEYTGLGVGLLIPTKTAFKTLPNLEVGLGSDVILKNQTKLRKRINKKIGKEGLSSVLTPLAAAPLETVASGVLGGTGRVLSGLEKGITKIGPGARKIGQSKGYRTAELTSIPLVASGSYFATKGDYGDATTLLSTEIALGILDPKRIAVSGANSAKSGLKNMFGARFSRTAREEQAAQYLDTMLSTLRKELGDIDENLAKELTNEKVVEALTKASQRMGGENISLTPAQLTASPVFMALEGFLRNKSPDFNAASIKASEKGLEALENLINVLKQSNDPNALRVAAEFRKDTLADIFDSQITSTINSASKKAEDLVSRGKLTSEEGLAYTDDAVFNVLQETMKASRAVERKLYEPLTSSNLKLRADNTIKGYYNGIGEIPKSVQKGLDDAGMKSFINRNVGQTSLAEDLKLGKEIGSAKSLVKRENQQIAQLERANPSLKKDYNDFLTKTAKAAGIGKKEFESSSDFQNLLQLNRSDLNLKTQYDDLLAKRYENYKGVQATKVTKKGPKSLKKYEQEDFPKYLASLENGQLLQQFGQIQKFAMPNTYSPKVLSDYGLRKGRVVSGKIDEKVFGIEQTALREAYDTPVGTEITLGELISLRSTLLKQQRSLEKGATPDYNTSRQIGKTIRDIENDLDAFARQKYVNEQTSEVMDDLMEARVYTKTYNDRFTRSFVGDTFSKQARGDLRKSPEMLLEELLLKGSRNLITRKNNEVKAALNFLRDNSAAVEKAKRLGIKDKDLPSDLQSGIYGEQTLAAAQSNFLRELAAAGRSGGDLSGAGTGSLFKQFQVPLTTGEKATTLVVDDAAKDAFLRKYQDILGLRADKGKLVVEDPKNNPFASLVDDLDGLETRDTLLKSFENYNDAIVASKRTGTPLQSREGLGKYWENHTKREELGGFLGKENPSSVVADIFNSKAPTAQFTNVVKQLDSLNLDASKLKEAKATLNNSVFEYLLDSTKQGKNISPISVLQKLDSPISEGSKDTFEKFILNNKLLPKEDLKKQLNNFKSLMDDMSNIELSLGRTGGAGASPLADQGLTASQLLFTRIIGAGVGTEVSQKLGLNSTLIAASAGSEALRTMFGKTPSIMIQDILIEASQPTATGNQLMLNLLSKTGKKRADREKVISGFLSRHVGSPILPAAGLQFITSDPVPEPERRPVNLDNISNVPQRSADFALRNQPVAPAPRPANQSQRAQYASMFPNDITSSVIRNQPQQQGIGSLME